MKKNKVAGKKGGSIAKMARLDLEDKTGSCVVTGESFLPSERRRLKNERAGMAV